MFLNKKKTIFLTSILSFAFLIIFTQVKSQELRVVDVSDIFLLFSTQAFWIGILASAILVAGIVYVRSSNSDHAMD